jgi:hypothetical protein
MGSFPPVDHVAESERPFVGALVVPLATEMPGRDAIRTTDPFPDATTLPRIIDKCVAKFEDRIHESSMGQLERLRQDPGADPIEVLRAISAFQKYFAAIEKEAVKVARSQDRTWHEIGAALGRSRQAIWHRAAPRVDESKAADWQALGRRLEDSWAISAEVRYNIGMSPP